MKNYGFEAIPGSYIVISIPKEQGEQITVSTVECESSSMWGIIGKALKESIQDIQKAREETHRKYPELFVPLTP
jgi:hypothetical protein